MFEIEAETIPKYVRKVEDAFSRYQLMRYLFRLDDHQIISWGLEDLLFYFTCLCRFREENRVLYELKKAKKHYEFY